MNFLDEKFWLAVSFFIFLYFAYKPVKHAIINALDAKIAAIKNDVAEAAELKAQAHDLLQKAQAQMANLSKLKEEILQDAEISTKALLEERGHDVEYLLKYKKQEASGAIEKKRTEVCESLKLELSGHVAELAKAYLQKLGSEALSDAEIAKRLS